MFDSLYLTSQTVRFWSRLLLIASLYCMGFSSSLVFGQSSEDKWWEGIHGFGTPDYSGKSKRQETSKSKETINDLRNGPIPLRSDEVVQSIDDAIAQYRNIVSKGGWPKIPGSRMMRPGDDDDRVAILRKRLRLSGDLPASKSFIENINFDGSLEQAVHFFPEDLRPCLS